MNTNKEKNFVSAVIYVHNAGKHLFNFLNTIIDTFEEHFENSEIICVNDCSVDNSIDQIRESSQRCRSSAVSVINMSYFQGVELSMNAGVDLAIGDYVFEFDYIDYALDTEMMMLTYNHALSGYDIVSASPKGRRKITSALFYYMLNRFSSIPHDINTETFRILSRRAINRIKGNSKTTPYRKASYAAVGLKIDNLKIDMQSKVCKPDAQEKRYRSSLAVDTLVLFTDFGYRFSVWMTSLMMLMSAFMIAYTVIVYLIGHPIEGWTTTVLFFSIAFFGLFGILTIVVKYLQIIVNLIFKRNRYVYESVEKITRN